MNPGKLDTPLEIWVRTQVRSATGDTSSSWVKAASVWGDVNVPWSGNRLRSDGVAGRQEETHVITVRPSLYFDDASQIQDREVRTIAPSVRRFRLLNISDSGPRGSALQLSCALVTVEDR